MKVKFEICHEGGDNIRKMIVEFEGTLQEYKKIKVEEKE